MIPISRQLLHELLEQFPNFCKSPFRSTFEQLRGSIENEEVEEILNNSDREILAESILSYIRTSVVSDMKDPDNGMLHSFIHTYFFSYPSRVFEIPSRNGMPRAVHAYFFKLNQELELVNNLFITKIFPVKSPILISVNKHSALEWPSYICNKSIIKIWLTHFLSHPILYLDKRRIKLNLYVYSVPILKLREYRYKRKDMENFCSDIRLIAEQKLVNFCKKIKLYQKELKLLSIGSGNGLQEFVILLKLLQIGYKKIELVLTASANRPVPGYDLTIINRLIYFLSQAFDAKIIVNYYSSVETLKREISQKEYFDAIYIVDFGQPQNYVNYVFDNLKRNGLLIRVNNENAQKFFKTTEKYGEQTILTPKSRLSSFDRFFEEKFPSYPVENEQKGEYNKSFFSLST